jgi:hypothetical protein
MEAHKAHYALSATMQICIHCVGCRFAGNLDQQETICTPPSNADDLQEGRHTHACLLVMPQVPAAGARCHLRQLSLCLHICT